MRLALATIAASLSVHYPMRGSMSAPGEHSCGAAERLARDTYDVVLNSDGAVVNGTPWKIDSRTSTGAVLSHQNDGAYVRMTLHVEQGGAVGKITLSGIDANREACSDSAYLLRR